jgi:hypothetical protein
MFNSIDIKHYILFFILMTLLTIDMNIKIKMSFMITNEKINHILKNKMTLF